MHRISDIAKLAGLYSGSPKAEQDEAIALTANTEVMHTLYHLELNKGFGGRKEAMERTRHSKTLAATTKDMREIAREAHRRGLNRQMKPAQFKLLDPRGTHIIAPKFFHDRADGKLVDMHVRCNVHLKLLGKQQAIEAMIDVPMGHVEDYLTGQEKLELMDMALEYGAVEDLDDEHSKAIVKRRNLRREEAEKLKDQQDRVDDPDDPFNMNDLVEQWKATEPERWDEEGNFIGDDTEGKA